MRAFNRRPKRPFCQKGSLEAPGRLILRNKDFRMASPVSIGDVLLLCKLAFRLGRTFTSGRKSAPAELREVENQLYSLSAALSYLHTSPIAASSQLANGALAAELEDGQHGRVILAKMLENCGETLSHLESVVERYATMKGSSSNSEESLPKRWSKRLLRDFNKIKWTTEGGDLAVLRSQLMIHINSINVVLGVVNNEHIGRIEDTLGSAIPLLKEIQKYVSQGRHATPVATVAMAQPQQSQEVTALGSFTPSFELCMTLSNDRTEVLCPAATLDPHWSKSGRLRASGDSEASGKLFICGCLSPPVQHATRLSPLSLTPLSFVIRLADHELSWMVYKIADRDSGSQISLVIRKLSPRHLVDFEGLFVRMLSTSRARSWLRQGMGTTLAFVAKDLDGRQEALVLSRIADISSASSAVECVTITADNLTYSRKDIDDMEITHYVKCELQSFLSVTEVHSTLQPRTCAHIVIYYRAEMGHDSDIVKTTIKLEYNTRVRLCGECTEVTLDHVECTGTTTEGHGHDLPSGMVSIKFSSQSAAERFKAKVKQMCIELSLICMRSPQPNEEIVLQLEASAIHTEAIATAEASLLIVRDITTSLSRLIITSHDGRTIVSQRLPPDFADNRSSSDNFRSRTLVAQILESGRIQIKEYPDGFSHLFVSDVRTNKLFQGWIQSRLWQYSLPFRNLPLLPPTSRDD
ncbi:hypothetical protein B0T14DRAFT_146378 [Immersiella caudata]|uniref:Uncharacterized protein n=1 Tax=Immersiella caudata TaxID=314043 RepID=A0AA39X6L3_9PEZI|nr:hypothetical protein B0T14DRAFT_146378 [Immersiella caudata]